MKKLILGLMLIMGSLSFSNDDLSSSHHHDRGIDNHDFSVKIKTSKNINKHSYNERLLFGISSEHRD